MLPPSMTSPPPLPTAPKNLRLASVLNLTLPGVGLFYLGRRKLGAMLALLFIACFMAAMTAFLIGYARYLSLAMSDHLLEGDQIEQIGHVFPRGLLVGLAVAGGVIYICSGILFRSAKQKLALAQRAG
jgi:hypothetical protein